MHRELQNISLCSASRSSASTPYNSKILNMKVIVQLLIVTAVLTAVPAAKQTRADWGRVQTLGNLFYTLVSTSLSIVKNAANMDNPTIGESIGLRIDMSASEATVLMENAFKAIEDQTLEPATAQMYFKGIEVIFMHLQQDIQEDVYKLTLATQNSIRNTFANAYSEGQDIAFEMYDALED